MSTSVSLPEAAIRLASSRYLSSKKRLELIATITEHLVPILEEIAEEERRYGSERTASHIEHIVTELGVAGFMREIAGFLS